MKKVLLKAGKIVVENLPQPGDPKGTELRVQVCASAISTGTETAQLVGGAFNVGANKNLLGKAVVFFKEHGVGATIKKIQERLMTAAPLGYSAAGVIDQCGSEVSGFAPGDRVAVSGAQFANHAETVLASSRLAVKIPQGVSMEEAATSAIGAIALQGVRRMEAQVGENIVVIGLGLIGQITAQILNAAGCQVIGIEKDSARLQFAKDRGWIHWGFSPTDAELETKVLHAGSGHGADGVIIAAHAPGDASAVELAVRLARRRARIVVLGDVGIAAGRKMFYEKELDLRIATSYGPGRYDSSYEEQGHDYPHSYVRWTAQRNMACYLDLIAKGKIQIAALIQAVYPIEDAVKAYDALQNPSGPKPLLSLLSYPSQPVPGAPVVAKTVYMPSSVKTGKIRVGLIGAGNFVSNIHLPILLSIPEFEIKAICNKRPEKAVLLAKQYKAKACSDAREIFNDPEIDLVLIGTRHDTHASLAMQAIEKGKALFLEKPMATTLEDLEALERAYKERPVPFHIGFNRRYSPFANSLKKSISEQTGPKILNYRVTAESIPSDHWVMTKEGGGRIVGEACHMVDLIGYLFSEEGKIPALEEVKVSALGSPQGANYHENFSVVLRYENEKMATLAYTPSKAQGFGKERIEVTLPQKSFVLNDFRSLDSAVAGSAAHHEPGTKQEKGFREEWLMFRDYLTGKRKESPCDFYEALEVTKLTFLIDQLARGSGQN